VCVLSFAFSPHLNVIESSFLQGLDAVCPFRIFFSSDLRRICLVPALCSTAGQTRFSSSLIHTVILSFQDSLSICTRIYQRNMEQLRACNVCTASILLDDAVRIDHQMHIPIVFKSDVDNLLCALQFFISENYFVTHVCCNSQSCRSSSPLAFALTRAPLPLFRQTLRFRFWCVHRYFISATPVRRASL
jgi:hypothetical protein